MILLYCQKILFDFDKIEKFGEFMSEENTNVPTVESATPTEKIADVDRLALELAKSKRETALAEAKTALANNEKADLAYRYVVLQIYLKYGMTDKDALNENGEIVRGGVGVPTK